MDNVAEPFCRVGIIGFALPISSPNVFGWKKAFISNFVKISKGRMAGVRGDELGLRLNVAYCSNHSNKNSNRGHSTLRGYGASKIRLSVKVTIPV